MYGQLLVFAPGSGRYNAALKADRFRSIVNFLKPQVQSTGDCAWAWNETRGEAAVYHSSRDTNIVTLST